MTDSEEAASDEIAAATEEEVEPTKTTSKAKTLRTWAIDLAIGAALAVVIVSAFNRWG